MTQLVLIRDERLAEVIDLRPYRWAKNVVDRETPRSIIRPNDPKDAA